ncbi:beta-lactamase family protein [Streptomyces sp. NA04227]|uniref:serine hydrolase domain-containing protein n=1 Tax=Streptomyces sp. NA04227 TaxID=2742136 RepID=UPI0015909AD1|nr:serine hydrolase domain-containing protein [Streptomyces sp. NA04227]QKW08934.1 beta-lactamase family protein [Streptomyces sp. NA04227]
MTAGRQPDQIRGDRMRADQIRGDRIPADRIPADRLRTDRIPADWIRTVCEQALAAHDCPSVSVAVVERGEVVLAEAFGLADIASGRPATPATVYGLASVTKPFTAAAVRRTADEGLLDLDAPVPMPVPGHHSAALGPQLAHPAPTHRQLLSHRAGLAPYYDFHYLDEDRPRAPRIDPAPYLGQVRAPGTDFAYANLGYLLAARELERSTGRSLADVVREKVCAPLGLDSWHLGDSHRDTYPGPAPTAVRYTSDGRAYPSYTVSHPGATLGWATAADTALFASVHGQLAAAEDGLRELGTVTPHLGYGLGWCVSTGPGPRILSHGGGGPGVAAFTASVPELELAVAVLCNSTDKAARDAVVAELLGELVPGFGPEQISPVASEPGDGREPRLPESGKWTGSLATPEGELPAVLTLGTDGHAVLEVADERAEAIATASSTGSPSGGLRADFPLQLPTLDARINSPRLALVLNPGSATGATDATLEGLAHAYKAGDREGRLGAFLSHRCVLRRD